MVSIEDIKFGIEIETFGYDRHDSETMLNRFFSRHSNYNNNWKCVYDGSIDDNGTSGVCEFVSPLLSFNEIEQVCDLVTYLKESGYGVDESCGIHVHVSNIHETPNTLINMVRMVSARYDLFCKACVMSTYRMERWNARPSKEMLKDLNTCETFNDIARVWYGSRNRGDGSAHYYGRVSSEDARYCMNEHYHPSRYQLVNLHSYFQGKGVEIRAFNGSLNPIEVKAYIEISCAMYAKAINEKRSNQYTRHNESSEKRQMKDFLWSMELRGKNPKWKSTRWVMSRNLEGSEW